MQPNSISFNPNCSQIILSKLFFLKGDEAPHPRSDSDLVYDAKGSRIFLFGGWANRWFDDLYILDVGSVVGPPYAIMGIKPKIGK